MNCTGNILIKDPYLNTSFKTDQPKRPHSTSIQSTQPIPPPNDPIVK